MKEIILYTLVLLLVNAGLFIMFSFIVDKMDNRNIGDSIAYFLGFIIVSLVVQIIIALMLIATEKKVDVGKAMLLSVGVICLVGLSLCSGLWN
jgi:hypothetical protein